jgi:hypothetical protein
MGCAKGDDRRPRNKLQLECGWMSFSLDYRPFHHCGHSILKEKDEVIIDSSLCCLRCISSLSGRLRQHSKADDSQGRSPGAAKRESRLEWPSLASGREIL